VDFSGLIGPILQTRGKIAKGDTFLPSSIMDRLAIAFVDNERAKHVCEPDEVVPGALRARLRWDHRVVDDAVIAFNTSPRNNDTLPQLWQGRSGSQEYR
jgi:hypothetical protein